MPNNTGMQLNEFKDLLRKVLNTPGMLEDIATGGIIPTGGIIAWSGSSVPTGWYLCDGTNGTPNLTNKFVYGGTIAGVGTTATEQTVTIGNHSNHVVTQPSNHVFTQTNPHGSFSSVSVDIADTGSGTLVLQSYSFNETHSGAGVDAHTNTAVDAHSAHSVTQQYFPPYYTLAYIMKG